MTNVIASHEVAWQSTDISSRQAIKKGYDCGLHLRCAHRNDDKESFSIVPNVVNNGLNNSWNVIASHEVAWQSTGISSRQAIKKGGDCGWFLPCLLS